MCGSLNQWLGTRATYVYIHVHVQLDIHSADEARNNRPPFAWFALCTPYFHVHVHVYTTYRLSILLQELFIIRIRLMYSHYKTNIYTVHVTAWLLLSAVWHHNIMRPVASNIPESW